MALKRSGAKTLFTRVKRWIQIKKHNTKKDVLRKIISPKSEVKRLPGKKIPYKEIKNKERFNKLSLAHIDRSKPVHRPGLTIRERRRLEQLGGVRGLDDQLVKTNQSVRKKVVLANKTVADTTTNKDVAAEKTKQNTKNKSEPVVTTGDKDASSVKIKPNRNRKSEPDEIDDDDNDNYSYLSRNLTIRETTDYSLDFTIEARSISMMSRYDTEDEYESPKRLPPISEGLYQDNQESPTSSRRRNNTSPNTARKMTVSERLYDPDYKKNRQIPKEPEPVYVREFKSKPPKNLEHVTSRHMDASYYEPKGEYVLEETEEWPPQFKHRVPKRLENVQSRHLSPEYHRKRVPRDNSPDDSPVFVARPPKKLEHVQSRIMDQRYFAERSNNEDKQEKYDTEFKARLPKKLEHVQSRILDPKKPKPVLEEEDVYQTNFKAKPPKQLGHVGSRILDPSFYEPRSEYVYEKEEEFDTSFKAKLPRSLQHVDTRIYDERYYKKKIPPITSEDRVVENMQTDFKAKLPRSMQHVQSRAFDPAYNKQLATPRNDSPVLELKSKGSFVLINVKKDAHGNPIRSGYANRLTEEKMGDKNHFNQGRKDVYGKKNDIKGDKRSGREPENNKNNNGNGDETPTEKPKRKPYKPPKKPKAEKIDRDFFDSWVMTPTHIVNDSEDMFYRNRQNVSQMWNSLAKTIHKTVIENGDRVQAYDRAYYR